MTDSQTTSGASSRLTFAIPVYERTSFFEEALDSALGQSIACQIVVVDNGSSHDRFREIVAAKASDRIRFYKNSENIGMFANWNLAARYAQTEFVMILGDDDYVLPGYAQAFERALQDHPDIDAYYTAIRWFSAEPMSFPTYTYPVGYQSGRTMLEFAARYGLGIPTTSLCLRRSLFDRAGFVEKPHGNSDWLFAYENLATATVFGNPGMLAGYRKHPEADTLTGNTPMVTALSCPYIYWRIGQRLDELGSSALARKARRRARDATIYCGFQWRESYRRFLAEAPPEHVYAQFVKDTILPASPLARAFSLPNPFQALLVLFARLCRKSLHLVRRARTAISQP